MRKQRVKVILILCLFFLSACQGQADTQPAPTPTPAPAMEQTDAEEAQEMAEEYAEMQEDQAEEMREIQEEWAEEMQDLQEDLADAQQDLQEELSDLPQNIQTKLRSSGINVTLPSLYEISSHVRVGMDPVRAGSILFIPEKPVNNETVDQLAEDMQVMSMILEEIANPPQNAGRQILFGGKLPMAIFGSHFRPAPQATWIDGYGIVFLLEVEYPVVAINVSDAKQSAPTEDKEDEVWKRSKNKLKGLDQPETKEEKVIVFDPDRVELLRGKLIGALKHAANIRTLSPSDRIVVVVRSIINGDVPGRHEHYGTKTSVPVPTSVMTLQAVKKDIDAFGAGTMELDTFKKKVSVVVY